MTAHTWQSLCNKKYRLSFRLFLLLNIISVLFSFALPISGLQAITLPFCLILSASTLALIWHMKFPRKKINVTAISFIFGCLWAWHIIIKYRSISAEDSAWLLIALLSVLFIGSLAFASNIIAFLLHSFPALLGCLWLSSGEMSLRMLYAFALPGIGITIQHIIQKRNDNFAQALMHRLMQERKTLNDLSMLDPLTGLYNRRGLQNKLDNLLALSEGSRFVLLLDIDHFKAYNDHYGHMMGDQALIRVSAAIRDAVRSRDVVARFGGEEFLVLLNHVDLERARATAERIRQHVFDLKIPHMFNESVATNVTISIGIAELEEGDIDAAIGLADKALYEAKHQGRNSILVASALQVA